MGDWKFNKGEWGEAYVFLRLLGVGRIFGANREFKKDENVYLDILEIYRKDKENLRQFFREFSDDRGGFVVRTELPDGDIQITTATIFDEQASFIHKCLTTRDEKMDIMSIMPFLNSLGLTQPAAGHLNAEERERFGSKTDIILRTQSSLDGVKSTEGFSIKSYFGSKPTLFNASKASALRFRILGCNDAIAAKLNVIGENRELDIYKEIYNNPNISLEYARVRSEDFANNIMYADSNMDIILKTALLLNVGYGCEPINDIVKITEGLAEIDPIGRGLGLNYYEYKMKNLIFDAFSGLTASTPWDGRKRLTGGYIDVSKNGEILYYRAISDDVFSTFLYKNTKFDRPDRGVNKDIAVAKAKAFLEGKELSEAEIQEIRKKGHGARCDFGYVFKEENEWYIDLNFQIRFK